MQQETVRVRPSRPPHRSILEPVTEISERTSGSYPPDSPSSSSSGREKVPLNIRNLTEQFRSLVTERLDSNEGLSLSSYEQISSSSLPSQFSLKSSKSSCGMSSGDSLSVLSQLSPKSSQNRFGTSQSLSKSSHSSIGMSVGTINVCDLGEYEEPPKTVFHGTSTSTGESLISMPGLADQSYSNMPSLANHSDFSMPSLSDFSGPPDNSGYTSIMPSLGEIENEKVSGSFSAFNTGESIDESRILISGRPMAEILKDEGKVAGKTLDVLAPTMHLKQPQTERWHCDQYTKKTRSSEASDAAPPMAVRRRGEAVPSSNDAPREAPISFHLDEPDDEDNFCSPDCPPQMVQRQISDQIPNNYPELQPVAELGNRFQLEHRNSKQKMVKPRRAISTNEEIENSK